VGGIVYARQYAHQEVEANEDGRFLEYGLRVLLWIYPA